MSITLSIKLTVYYENPFWVGVFERTESDKIETCKVVFGSEPRDCEIYEFILKNYRNLKFSKPISIDSKSKKRINPKRLQKQIHKSTEEKGISTKSQIAIKLQLEANKVERKKTSKEQKELQKKLDYEKKQQKKKQKKRGH